MKQQEKQRIIRILTESFGDNQSTNFVIKQDGKRDKRLKTLIEYSIFHGENFGQVFLSDDQNACAIILDSNKKKTTFKSILWDLRLVFQCIGIRKVWKVLKRESLIKSFHPKEGFIHLWYVGVLPSEQGRGLGTGLLEEIIALARSENKRVYLETSNERNFALYEGLGFKEVATVDQLGYSIKMYCLI